MPKRFTPEQFAASAAAGQPRSEQFFSGDSGAWHAHQESFYSTLLGEVLPPVGDGRRAGCWKRARRQRGKIEAQREKKAADVALVTDENDVTNEHANESQRRSSSCTSGSRCRSTGGASTLPRSSSCARPRRAPRQVESMRCASCGRSWPRPAESTRASAAPRCATT